MTSLKDQLYIYQGYTDRAQADQLAAKIIKELEEHMNKTTPTVVWHDDFQSVRKVTIEEMLRFLRGETK